MTTPLFSRYIGIDYSGAQTPTSSLKGLRIYVANIDGDPREIAPPPSPRKYWTRRGVAEWLLARLAEDIPTVVGIDHGFSFPLAYFEKHRLAHDWPAFLEDFHRHWPTDGDNVYVDSIRDGSRGMGSERGGDTRWRRVTEKRAGAAKSVFHFDVQGSVAKSTHSGLPWLLRLRLELADRVHFWPFDGWEIAPGRSTVVEVYPALWNRAYAPEDRTSDQHDAYSVARRLREADCDGTLSAWLAPALPTEDLVAVGVEGWILGVGATPARVTTPNRSPAEEDPKPRTSAAQTSISAGNTTAPEKTLHVVRGIQSIRASTEAHRPRVNSLVHHFLVVLGETDPVVWRRIEVPERYSFWDLHVAIQDAMGWQDYHLHEFAVVHPKRKRLERIGIPDDEFIDEKPCLPGWKVRVSDYVHRSMPPMLYTYDFGDDWRHVLFYEETWSAEDSISYPRCVAGARRCPPEDCGGTQGYRDFLAAVADRRHPDHATNLKWVGGSFNPTDFDPAAVRFEDPTERWKAAPTHHGFDE